MMVAWTQASTALTVAARGGQEMSPQMIFQSCLSGSRSWLVIPGGLDNLGKMALAMETWSRLTLLTATFLGKMKIEVQLRSSCLLN